MARDMILKVHDDDGTCSITWKDENGTVRTKHGGIAMHNRDGTGLIRWPDGSISKILSHEIIGRRQ